MLGKCKAIQNTSTEQYVKSKAEARGAPVLVADNAELVPERVVHDDEDRGGDPGLVLRLDPKGDIVEADHVPTHPKRLCPPRSCKVPGLG